MSKVNIIKIIPFFHVYFEEKKAELSQVYKRNMTPLNQLL